MSSPQGTSARQRRSVGLVGNAPKELPTTARGLRTRANLIASARTVFERDGFLDARLIDITTEAKISAGSFYTYFESKEEIFAAVLAEVESEMLHPAHQAEPPGDDPVGVIRESNRAYIESYQKNAKFMRLLNQVSSIDDDFRQLRRQRGESFIKRNARSITELQERGIADPGIDAFLAASFLSGMVSRAAFAKFVNGEDWDIDEMVETLTTLWVNSLKIKTD